MYIRSYLFLLLAFGTFTLAAQHGISDKEFAAVPVRTMPTQDNARLLGEELARRRPGRPRTFAVMLPTTIRPGRDGVWFDRGATATWALRVSSPGAETLNLGFSEYQLPPGAELYLSTPDERLGPFTAADNESHNQLWTPLVFGDELLLELHVPTNAKSRVRLYLTSVNHDFENVIKSLPNSSAGKCNLDVICGAEDDWAIVEPYRDIIRSVAAYTLNGTDQCTGFLVNNTNEDGRPFFMTANHCNVRQSSSPSLVAYWNYQSPDCRQPLDEEAGGTNVGDRNTANSGTIFRARSRNSDMCLLEFDDPINRRADHYFAGWDLSPVAPVDTVVAIHHPQVEEKRISFSFEDTYRSGQDHMDEDRDGRYLIVPKWSVGTTERGSSGSPLFDSRGLVRGQLWRGAASCSAPDGHDQYGYFASSWEGDGTMDSSLKGWLDPCGLDPQKLGGFDGRDEPFTITADNNCIDACVGDDFALRAVLGSGFTRNTELSIVENTTGVTPAITLGGGGAIVLDVDPMGNGLTRGSYTLVLRAEENGRSDDIRFTVDLNDANLSATELQTPQNGSANVSPTPDLIWGAVEAAELYEFQLASDPGFTRLVESGESAVPEASIRAPLAANQTYYWRARPINACAIGGWSTASFTVANVICGQSVAVLDDDAIITDEIRSVAMAVVDVDQDVDLFSLEVTIEISHTWVGDLDATLTTPAGRTIQLFEAPGGGNCSWDNLSVTFSDAAPNSAEDFVTTCDNRGDFAIEGLFQPADPLREFAGGSTLGRWTLEVTDSGELDAGVIESFSLAFCSGETTSTRDFGRGNSITIFPNPTDDRVTVSVSGDWPARLGATLIDAMGRRVRSLPNLPTGDSEWSLGELATGIYFLQVGDGQRRYTERIVVTR